MFFRSISSYVSVFHQRMDETRDEIIAIAAHFLKRLLVYSVVFLTVNAVNRRRDITSLLLEKKSSACQHLQERGVMRKNLPS